MIGKRIGTTLLALALYGLGFSQYVDTDRDLNDYSTAEAQSLQSLPGSPNVIYLDLVQVNADGDYDQTIQRRLINSWRAVSEDFRIFNINVTTDGDIYDATPQTNRVKYKLIAHSSGGQCGEGFGGIPSEECHGAFNPNTISHEIGHSLVAKHQSGEGTALGILNIKGQIMSWGNKTLYTTWSEGYSFPGNDPNDVLYASTINNITNILKKIPLRADDHGSNIGTATPLVVNNEIIRKQDNNGIIEEDGDYDVFSFTTTGGDLSLDVSPMQYHNNLHVAAEIVDGAGDVVLVGSSTFHFDINNAVLYFQNMNMGSIAQDYLDGESIQIKQGIHFEGTLNPGTYYIRVTNSGFNDGNNNGYPKFFSRGYFEIDGSIATTPPIADFDIIGLVCQNSDVRINNNSTAGPSSTYSWTFNGANIGSSNAVDPPDISFATLGTYDLTLTVSNSAGSSTVTKQVIVGDKPHDFTISKDKFHISGDAYVTDPGVVITVDYGGQRVLDASADDFYENPSNTDEMKLGICFTEDCYDVSIEKPFRDRYENYVNLTNGQIKTYYNSVCGGHPIAPQDNTNNLALHNFQIFRNLGSASNPEEDPGGWQLVEECFSSSTAGHVSFVNAADGSEYFNINPVELSTSAIAHTYQEAICIEQGIAPKANFDTILYQCIGNSITLANYSRGIDNTYEWTFEGATPATSTSENPTITFNSGGLYKITLTATNDVGTDTFERWVEVGSFSYDFMVSSGKFNDNINVKITSNTTGQVMLNADDSDFSSNGGFHTVNTCLANDCYTVEVEDPFEPETCGHQLWQSWTTYNTAGTTVVHDQKVYTSNYWTQGNQPPHGAWTYVEDCIPNDNSSHYKLLDANSDLEQFNVTMTQWGADLQNPRIHEFCIGCNNPGLAAIVNSDTDAEGPFEICSGESIPVKTTIGGSGDFTHTLFLDDVEQSTNNTGTFTLDQIGDYHVIVADADDASCKSISSKVNVKIGQLPNSPEFALASDVVCLGLSNKTYSVDAQNYVTYSWSYHGTGTTLTETDESVSIDFANNATSGTLTVEASNTCGTEEASIDITVEPCLNPVASFTLDKTSICPGDTVTFTSFASGVSGGETYDWSFAGGTPNAITGAGPHKIIFNGSGTFDASLSVTDGDNTHDTIITNAVIVNDIPVISISGETSVCNGATETYNIDDATGIDSFSWSIAGGAAFSSVLGLSSVDVDFGPENSNTISLGAISDLGCESEVVSLAVSVVDCIELIASFTTNKSSICPGETVTFTSNSDGVSSNTEYSWDFGTGATPPNAIGTGPFDVTYNTIGTATATLFLVDGVKSSDTTSIVSINDCSVITAGFGVDKSSICIGDTVVFTSNSTGASTGAIYTWGFGNSTASGIGPHQVIYTGAGSFSASLSIVDGSKSDDAEVVDIVVVYESPILDVADADLCENDDALDLTSLVFPIGGSFEGSASNSWDPSLSGIGTFPLTYHYQDVNGCKASAPLQINVQSTPEVSALDGEFCVLNESIILSNASPTGGIYAGTGVNTNAFDPALAGVGTHTISYDYTDPNTSCSAATSFEIIVSSSITPFIALSTIDHVCEAVETTVAIDQQSLTGDLSGTTYNWYVVDGGTNALAQGPSSDLSQQVAFLQGQGIFVEMTIPNNGCLVNTSTQSLTIYPDVAANIDPVITASNTILCDESSIISLSASDANGNTNLSWSWLLNGSPTDVGQNIAVSQIGTYSLIGSNPLNCPSETSVFTIDPFEETLDLHVDGNDLSTITVQEGQQLQLDALYSGNDNVNYNWSSDDNSLNSTQQQVFVDPTSGITYFISVSTPEGCLLFDSLIVDIDAQLVVSPLLTPNGNGTNDSWEIQGLNGFDSHDIKVINKWGTQAYHSNDYYANPWEGNNPKTGQPLPQGTYFYIIQVTDGDESSVLSGYLTILK
jgi:gliding motility-associated-like protein